MFILHHFVGADFPVKYMWCSCGSPCRSWNHSLILERMAAVEVFNQIYSANWSESNGRYGNSWYSLMWSSTKLCSQAEKSLHAKLEAIQVGKETDWWQTLGHHCDGRTAYGWLADHSEVVEVGSEISEYIYIYIQTDTHVYIDSFPGVSPMGFDDDFTQEELVKEKARAWWPRLAQWPSRQRKQHVGRGFESKILAEYVWNLWNNQQLMVFQLMVFRCLRSTNIVWHINQVVVNIIQ